MKAESLKSMVAYQDGSVVSKEIVRKDAGTVTLFAFDRGQGLSEHTAPFDALVSVLEGRAEVRISGEPVDVAEGQAVVMPAGKPHSVHAPERFKMMLVMIKR